MAKVFFCYGRLDKNGLGISSFILAISLAWECLFHVLFFSLVHQYQHV